MDGLTSRSVPLAVVLCVFGAIAVARGSRRRDDALGSLLPGGAMLAAGVLGLFAAPVWVQLGVAGAGWLLAWRWRSLLAEGNPLPSGTGAVRLIGMSGEVIDTVPAGVDTDGWDDLSSGDRPAVAASDRQPSRLVGRVRVGGEIWRAQSGDGTEISAGSAVTVMSVRGTRLVVATAGSDGSPPPGVDEFQTKSTPQEEET